MNLITDYLNVIFGLNSVNYDHVRNYIHVTDISTQDNVKQNAGNSQLFLQCKINMVSL